MATLSNTPTLASMVKSYAEIRAQREKLEAAAKALKEKEDDAKARLISEMDVQKIPSARFDGVGRVVLRQVRRYEISDIELFARAMLKQMVDNAKNGRRLSDGLMLQKRPAKLTIEELSATESWDADTAYAERGLTVADSMDLTFTKEKGANADE